MTTDPFTTAARAYARERYPSGTDLDRDRRMVVDEFAEWARAHLAEQEPTDDETGHAYAMSWHEPFAKAYDRWLAAHDARVKRDAAREALDGLAATHDAHFGLRNASRIGQEARIYCDTHYPETEDQT